MGGLKTVWIISRHYRSETKMKDLLELISNEIADKVENHIKINELLRMDTYPYEDSLDKSINLI